MKDLYLEYIKNSLRAAIKKIEKTQLKMSERLEHTVHQKWPLSWRNAI
jgi:hypothetical protein